MPRPKGYTKTTAQRRALAEDAAAHLAKAKALIPITRLRITQTLRRTGPLAVLTPAIEELADVEQAIQQAQELITRLGVQK